MSEIDSLQEYAAAADVRDALRSGVAVADAHFDAFYPRPIRLASSQFWTPVEVAIRAAQLLVVDETTRVLDVGSGAGKLCVIGSLVTGASFTGIEQRASLVDVARACAANMKAPVQFLHGRLQDVPWEAFDAFYLFNPFGENCFSTIDRLDDSIELSPKRYVDDVERVEELLAAAKVGTRVVTYHGFGGLMPETFELRVVEQRRTDYVKLWVKTSA